MLEDPRLEPGELASALRSAYGVEAREYRFIPSYDFDAASYEVATGDGGPVFLKVHFSRPAVAPLEVARALSDSGIDVVAPRPTRASGLIHAMGGGRSLVLYPYVEGRNAMVSAMTEVQWRAFGTVLRAVHDSPLGEHFADRLPVPTPYAAACTTPSNGS